MNTALCPSIRPARPALSRLFHLFTAWALLLAGGNLQAANTITKNVILGGTLDISPISSIYPALPPGSPAGDAYARMMVMHTTIPGTTKGTMWKTVSVDEYIWGSPAPNAFSPGNVSPNTQNRILGSQGFRYKSNGTGLNTSESIPIRFSNLLGTKFVDYTLVINIVDPSLGPKITSEPKAIQSVGPQSSAGMSVTATGPGPLTYQWYEGVPPSMQNPIGGATGPGYGMPPRPIGQYFFWVRVSNNIASVNSMTATVNVSNPPTADIGGPYTVSELDTITLSGANSSDPDSPFLAYKWDLDNNNIFGQSFDEIGESVTFSAATMEGPGTYPVGMQVYDTTDIMDADSTVITILNSGPRAVFTTNGAPGVVTFSNVKDSPGDLAAGIKYSFDLDNDGTFEIGYSATPTATVPAAFMAAYLNGRPVRGRTLDRDGGVSEYIAGVHGRGIMVTTLTDENNGGSWEIGRLPTSLREAIAIAESDVTPTAIYFDSVILTSLVNTVPCSVTQTISTHVVICGPDTGFGVEITGPAGFGIRGFAVTATGTLVLDRVSVTGFTGTTSPRGLGGAIWSEGTLIVRRSTLHGNFDNGLSQALGGAIFAGKGTVILENSTFFNNKTTAIDQGSVAAGGAVYTRNANLTVNYCTITGNSSPDTRGIMVTRDSGAAAGSATVNNTIIADASVGQPDFKSAGLSGAPAPVTSGANNIMRSISGFSGTFTNINPGLSGLTFNGGPTATMAPGRSSLAINRAVPTAGITTDQRGFPRPNAKRYDIGAVEFDGLVENLNVTTVTDEDDGTSDWLQGTGTSLREALAYAADHPGDDTITFHPSLAGKTVSLTAGWNNASDDSALRVVNQTVTIEGLATFPGVAIGIGGGAVKRHFAVESTGNLTLSRVYLGLGHVFGNGASVWSAGSFKSLGCAFLSNVAVEGGAVYAESGSPLCHLENCTFANNTVLNTGSAISSGAAQTMLRHLTVSGNGVSGVNGNALVFRQAQAELCNSLIIGNTGEGIGLISNATLNAQSTNNILGSGGTGGLLNGVNGNLTGVPLAAVKLGPLDFNGAGTPTMALQSGSIAVNQAVTIPGLTADQRGTARPTGTAPDIGAYEDTTNNGAGDADLDTVSNLDEYKNGTDIFNRDSDSDGYNDATERLAGTNPLSAASIPPANHVECVLGAAPGLGLDLAGTFTHAVNIGTNGAAGSAGNANFTADNAPGVGVTSYNNSANWFPVEFGATAGDTALEKLFSSNRWGAAAQPVQVTLSGLTPGKKYKLQLLFGEACCPGRTFDVIVDGMLAVDNFMPAAAQGGANVRYAASAVVREIIALNSTLSIVLSSANVPPVSGLITSPMLSGLTLEEGGFASALAQWRYLHGLPADGSQDLANPSGDGISNILKFAFNLAPLAGDLNQSNVSVFAPGGSSGLPAVQRSQNGDLVFDFLRRTAASAPEISYIPGTSTDLTVWQPVNLGGATITPASPGWERVIVTVPAPAGGRLFGRVETTVTN